MFKEPTALTTARAALKKAESDLRDPENINHLKNAVYSLLAVMSGNSSQIEKDIAKKLLLDLKAKVLSEAKTFLANGGSCDATFLEHWIIVIDVFVHAGLGDDPECHACKEKLLVYRGDLLIHSLRPADLAMLQNELQAALDSLSAHRSRLTNIDWGVRK